MPRKKPVREGSKEEVRIAKKHGILYSAYGKPIMAATRCRPEDTFQIETVMRCRFSTLDHLDRTEFDHEALMAWAAVKLLRHDGTYEEPDYANPVVPVAQ